MNKAGRFLDLGNADLGYAVTAHSAQGLTVSVACPFSLVRSPGSGSTRR